MIPYNQTRGIANESDVWMDIHTFLILKKGDVHDHAILLCSLLRGIFFNVQGFHLNAFVTFGLNIKNKAHVWVTTIDNDKTVTYWESLTGNRYTQEKTNENRASVMESFRTVGCCFNEKEYYANIQVIIILKEDLRFCRTL